jgi:NADH dehydrogenase
VVWAAGVTASPLAGLLAAADGAETDRAGRLTVEPDLTLPGHPEVFALGDMVTVRGQALHGVAPVAMQQGRHAARSIARGSREPFHYHDKGELATIGRSRAVGVVSGVRVSGVVAWMLWLGIHITYLVGFQNRLLVLTRWTFSYLTRGRGARVIHRS